MAGLVDQNEFISMGTHITKIAKCYPDKIALIDDHQHMSYGALADDMLAVGSALTDQGLSKGDVLAICAPNSIEYALVYLAATNLGIIIAPLPVTATRASLLTMISDCRPKLLLFDQTKADLFPKEQLSKKHPTLNLFVLKSSVDKWKKMPRTVVAEQVAADDIFNIIYSSGTTGVPKGIIQTHGMRAAHVKLGMDEGYNIQTVNLLSTPMYSNTTLVSFFPTIALGGTVILMSKFDCGGYLTLAEEYGVTHTMLVPVQYLRLMNFADFGNYELSTFRQKYCTSAPFSEDLKKTVLNRWPGGLTEYYGMTEGGGLCILRAHEHGDKLATVGQPATDNDIRIIDDDGVQIPPTEIGEIVGRSGNMMPGYLNRPDLSKDIFWTSPQGHKFIRTGDIGRFDNDGFLYLLDRKKDVVISGGFNIYPLDIENVLLTHARVIDAAVIGVPSKKWGETPVAYVVANGADPLEIKKFVNNVVGKMQRLADVKMIEEIPRSAIGKVLKRELRDQYVNNNPML